jgi:phosphoglucosamine mutase
VRGVANADLTAELVVALGRAAAHVLGPGPFLVGRDTRVSGPMLRAALTAGLTAEGEDVIDLEILPTPGVAHLSAIDGLPAAMLSASHNPFPDNGIKFFAAGGRKLPDATEQALEAELDLVLHHGPRPGGPVGGGVGAVTPGLGGRERYEADLIATLEGRRLDGMRVVIDCANGAAFAVAPSVLERLGVDLTVLHARPDGTNINAGCGSTQPDALQREVVARGAQVGLAFDGDADRMIAVDHEGRLVDGDQLIALCALDRRERNRLVGDTVVVTVMTNLGFRLAMAEHGIKCIETQVGDRYVLEAMEEGGWSLGGEQSGHLIFRDLATTGDGLLTALQTLDVMARRGRPLAELAAVMTRLPQVLRNVRVADRDGLEDAEELWAEVSAAEASLGERGRVLIRPSGTEPIVRVMVEASTAVDAERTAEQLSATVARVLGGDRPSRGDDRGVGAGP